MGKSQRQPDADSTRTYGWARTFDIPSSGGTAERRSAAVGSVVVFVLGADAARCGLDALAELGGSCGGCVSSSRGTIKAVYGLSREL